MKNYLTDKPVDCDWFR